MTRREYQEAVSALFRTLPYSDRLQFIRECMDESPELGNEVATVGLLLDVDEGGVSFNDVVGIIEG